MLTRGNAAKLYCLNRLDELAGGAESLTILDLGCGDATNFTALLRKHGHVRYVGVDPSAEACERARRTLDGLRAEILSGLDSKSQVVLQPDTSMAEGTKVRVEIAAPVPAGKAAESAPAANHARAGHS